MRIVQQQCYDLKTLIGTNDKYVYIVENVPMPTKPAACAAGGKRYRYPDSAIPVDYIMIM